MKTTALRLLGVCASLFTIVSCQRDKDLKAPVPVTDEEINYSKNAPANNSGINIYNIQLVYSNLIVGINQWEWKWKVTNPNPGNGNGGTIQNLSHWGFTPGGCLSTSDIVSAAYSSNNTNWTSFNPSIQPDPSQSCSTGNVLKFDFGSNGSATSYYRLVVNRHFTEGTVQAYYKSGNRTGCGTFTIPGITGCPPPPAPPELGGFSK